jgi:hypothetical protein
MEFNNQKKLIDFIMEYENSMTKLINKEKKEIKGEEIKSVYPINVYPPFFEGNDKNFRKKLLQQFIFNVRANIQDQKERIKTLIFIHIFLNTLINRKYKTSAKEFIILGEPKRNKSTKNMMFDSYYNKLKNKYEDEIIISDLQKLRKIVTKNKSFIQTIKSIKEDEEKKEEKKEQKQDDEKKEEKVSQQVRETKEKKDDEKKDDEKKDDKKEEKTTQYNVPDGFTLVPIKAEEKPTPEGTTLRKPLRKIPRSELTTEQLEQIEREKLDREEGILDDEISYHLEQYRLSQVKPILSRKYDYRSNPFHRREYKIQNLFKLNDPNVLKRIQEKARFLNYIHLNETYTPKNYLPYIVNDLDYKPSRVNKKHYVKEPFKNGIVNQETEITKNNNAILKRFRKDPYKN